MTPPATPSSSAASSGDPERREQAPEAVRAHRAIGLAAAGANSTVMAASRGSSVSSTNGSTRASTPRGAAVVIATVTTVITVGAGLLMTLIDHDTFSSLGTGIWWAMQTVTTVGYGDHVPESAGGRSWRRSSCSWGSASSR